MLTDFIHCVREMVLNGNTVKLDNLAIFKAEIAAAKGDSTSASGSGSTSGSGTNSGTTGDNSGSGSGTTDPTNPDDDPPANDH